MSSALHKKLVAAFDDLDLCIARTRETLSKRNDVPSFVVERFVEYKEIIIKQRKLADELRNHIEIENWDEVGQVIKVLNGLSIMIKDDAEALMAGKPGAEVSKEQGMLLC